MMEGMNVQQIDDLLEFANALLTYGLLGGVNEILYKFQFWLESKQQIDK
jgi:hypothetical protein